MTTIPIYGVSFSYLIQTFIMKPDDDFNIVCQQIKEITKNFLEDEDRSFASYLRSNPKTRKFVKDKADVFISYAWKGSWIETMEALRYHFRRTNHEDVFVWMDIVCVDQHKTNDLEFKDWSRVFQTSLKEIGKAVIPLVPAKKPLVPTRAWCCFEMTQMVQANIPYDICISPNDTKKLIKGMEAGQGFANWTTLFSLINVEKSIATKSSDQIAILELMNEIGIVQVNNVVLNSLKRFYVGVLANDAEKGADGKDLVFVLNARGALHEALGEVNEALPFYQQGVKESQLIPNNEQQTAILLSNLAASLYSQGKIDEAIPYFEQVIDVWKKSFGEDHPQVAIGYNNLAELLKHQGNEVEAELLHEQALAIRKHVLGDDHPDVAESLNNLALLFSEQGKFEQAKPLFEQAINIWKNTVGEDHPLVATGLNNLADLLNNQGEYSEANLLYQQSIAILKKTLGEYHPNVATLLNNFAILLRDQGKKTEARQLGKQAYDITLKSLGEDHPHTITYKYWETF